MIRQSKCIVVLLLLLSSVLALLTGCAHIEADDMSETASEIQIGETSPPVVQSLTTESPMLLSKSEKAPLEDSYSLWFSEPYIPLNGALPENLIYAVENPDAEFGETTPLEDIYPYGSFSIDNDLSDILGWQRTNYTGDEYLLLRVTKDDLSDSKQAKELSKKRSEIVNQFTYTNRLRSYLTRAKLYLQQGAPNDLLADPQNNEFLGYVVDGVIDREKIEEDYEKIDLVYEVLSHYLNATILSAAEFKPQFDNLGILNYVRGGILYIVIKISDFEKMELENADNVYFCIANQSELP